MSEVTSVLCTVAVQQVFTHPHLSCAELGYGLILWVVTGALKGGWEVYYFIQIRSELLRLKALTAQ